VKQLAVFLFAVFFIGTPTAAEPEVCSGSMSGDPESFIYAWVSETIKKGDDRDLESVGRCLWGLWPKRDGAFGKTLTDNLLYFADKDIRKFVGTCPNDDAMQSFTSSLQGLTFTARSASEKRFLDSLRNSLVEKSNRSDVRATSVEQQRRLAIFRKAISGVKVRMLE
jgi:hypothetical protein